MKKKHQKVLSYMNEKLSEGVTKIRLPVRGADFIEEIEKRGWKVEPPYVIHRTHAKNTKQNQNPNRKKSKKEMILEYFQGGGGLSLHDSLRLFGLSALSQRVTELRNEGYDIITQTRKGKGNDTYGFYFLRQFEHLHKYEK